MPKMKRNGLYIALCLLLMSCDNGLEPPGEAGTGSIRGTIEYLGTWPAADSLQDLRFVAMRFVPQDTSDFLQLADMEISNGLNVNVETDTFIIPEAKSGLYVYSGIAQQFEANFLSWRPVGLYTDTAGIFSVSLGESTEINIRVDFNNVPVFPPEL